MLGGLFRRGLPLLSSGVKILGQQAMNIASDMIDGKSFQDSAKSLKLKQLYSATIYIDMTIKQDV